MPNQKYFIKREREAAPAPFNWTALAMSSDLVKEIYDIEPLSSIEIFANNKALAIFLNKKHDIFNNTIGAKFFNDAIFFEKIENEIKKREEVLFQLFLELDELDFEKLELAEIINHALAIKKKMIFYESVATPAWGFGAESLGKLTRESLSIPEDDYLFLTTPKTKTIASQLEYNILKSAHSLQNKRSKINEEARKLSRLFGALPHGLDGLDYWDENYFVDLLKKHLAEDLNLISAKIKKIEADDDALRKKYLLLIKKHELNNDQLAVLNRLNKIIVWTDDRKMLTFKAFTYYHQLLLELEKRLSIPFKSLKFLMTEELILLKENPEEAINLIEQRRNSPFVIDIDRGGYKIKNETDAKKFIEKIKKYNQAKEIKGSVASKGSEKFYRGIAKVLSTSKEKDKINEGDFLVAVMTTPDFIFAMQKAIGFITDEGGVTCHAAIIAREMKKPCIIGTKNATKILKDGDKIEINIETGEIKVIP